MSEAERMMAVPGAPVRARPQPAGRTAASTAAIERGWMVAALLAAAGAGYYAALLMAGSAGLFGGVPHGLVFNNMAAHLVQGRFDVDPASIGDEGFVRDGAVYAYFGVLPALVRLPFLGLADFATTDFTRLSCLAAVTLMALFKTLSVLTVARRAADGNRVLIALLLAVLLAGGAQVQFLRPSIYQEPALWADSCAAAFVYLFLRGWGGESRFSPALLCGMAAAAGCGLLARVSTGLGLYAAFALLWLVFCRDAARANDWRPALTKLVAPAVVAAMFAAAVGGINAARWGNPLVFADLSRQLIALHRFPDRLVRLREYGEFNPIRLVYGLGYYVAPLWALSDGAGGLMWAAFRDRVFDSVELPPGSFLLSDPLLLGLAVYGVARLARHGSRLQSGLVWPVLGGLAVPPLLILMALALAFRYRLEFYPFLELAALVGFADLAASAGRRARAWCAAGALVSLVMAPAMWLLAMLSPFGPVQTLVGSAGVAAFYRSLF